MALLGTILVIPYMLVFLTCWLVASLSRPLAYATLVCLLLNPLAAKRKLTLFVTAFRYMAFCKDKKWKEPDPLQYTTIHKTEQKTVIFVRHGESLWNETFNRGERTKFSFFLYFIPNALKAFFVEWYLMVTGQDRESWFYDSPLSDKGKMQAEGIRKFLRTDLQYCTPQEARMIRLLLGEPPEGSDNKTGTTTTATTTKETLGPSSQLISSNLRRAISTLAIGVRDRLDRQLPGDNILILSQLQEISFNPDALCITPARGTCEPTFTDPKFLQPIFHRRIDTHLHTGNKPIDTNGLIRLQDFCTVLFDQVKTEHVVCAGHSLWFKYFFRTFLPRDYDHVSKHKKIRNGGCVGFTLEKKYTDNGVFYEVVPGSILVLYIGF